MDYRKKLLSELDEAEVNAWNSLARYKFQMFGYWVGIWVHLNRVSGERRPNPFKELVRAARIHLAQPKVPRSRVKHPRRPPRVSASQLVLSLVA